MPQSFTRDVVVVGGCGHVGLPLAIVLADRGLRVTAYDIDAAAAARIAAGSMPFDEPGAQPLLERTDRKSTRLNSSHVSESRMPSSA